MQFAKTNPGASYPENIIKQTIEKHDWHPTTLRNQVISLGLKFA